MAWDSHIVSLWRLISTTLTANKWSGTNWYDQALSECVLEELDFTVNKTVGEKWWCIDGGTQRVANLMRNTICQPIQFQSRVIAINANMAKLVAKRGSRRESVPITLSIKDTPGTSESTPRNEDYHAVFNSTTLGALQKMNLKDAGLLWGTKQAIRSLGYGASCKVAIKFSRPWWQLGPFNIDLGGVSRTDLPLRVCVYPSYNIQKIEGDKWDPEKPSVLLCSYTWAQDAQRIGSLISRHTPEDEEQLKTVLLHDLALLHANDEKPYETLLDELTRDYITHHAWDWYHDENSTLLPVFSPFYHPTKCRNFPTIIQKLCHPLLWTTTYSWYYSVRGIRLFWAWTVLRDVGTDHQAERWLQAISSWWSSISPSWMDRWGPRKRDSRDSLNVFEPPARGPGVQIIWTSGGTANQRSWREPTTITILPSAKRVAETSVEYTTWY